MLLIYCDLFDIFLFLRWNWTLSIGGGGGGKGRRLRDLSESQRRGLQKGHMDGIGAKSGPPAATRVNYTWKKSSRLPDSWGSSSTRHVSSVTLTARQRGGGTWRRFSFGCFLRRIFFPPWTPRPVLRRIGARASAHGANQNSHILLDQLPNLMLKLYIYVLYKEDK